MKRSKDELLNAIREHGGDTPDDFTIAMLEDISDSFIEGDNSEELESLRSANADLTAANESLTTASAELQASYDSLKKAYADRFTLKEEEVEEGAKDEPAEEEVSTESYDSIF
jgi:hypothetical protein